jgi:hypothetical protein
MAGAFRLNACCRVRLLLLVAGCTLGSVPVLAGEWEQSISLPATLEHDSNLPLSTTNKQGVSRLIVVPAYSLVGTYGIDEVQGRTGPEGRAIVRPEYQRRSRRPQSAGRMAAP